MIEIQVDPAKLKKVICPVTFSPIFEHMRWCMENCRSHWYNECEYYSYICFEDEREALSFALRFGVFVSDQEKTLLVLRLL